MADFKKAFNQTMQNEGGYVDDPHDEGGETYKGIARRYWGKWEGWYTIDILKNKGNFPNSLRHDSQLQYQIREFYIINFWNKIRGFDIKDQETAHIILDFAVNIGVKRAVKIAQAVCNVSTDGIIGPQTIGALNKKGSSFVPLYMIEKVKFYVRKVIETPHKKRYFFGWIRRVIK